MPEKYLKKKKGIKRKNKNVGFGLFIGFIDYIISEEYDQPFDR